MTYLSFTQSFVKIYDLLTKLEAFQEWLNVDMFVLLHRSIHWQQHQCKWFTSCWFDFFISSMINYWVTELISLRSSFSDWELQKGRKPAVRAANFNSQKKTESDFHLLLRIIIPDCHSLLNMFVAWKQHKMDEFVK